jgi:hypothetical protein
VGLADLAAVLHAAEQEQRAADAAEEAVERFRALGEGARAELAAALVLQSGTAYRAGRWANVTAPAREAVELWRTLTADDPVHGEPGLAIALRVHAAAEGATGGGPAVAAAAAREALAIHERLFEELPKAYHEERFLTLVTARETEHFLTSTG